VIEHYNERIITSDIYDVGSNGGKFHKLISKNKIKEKL
jgi:hypothetical protein